METTKNEATFIISKLQGHGFAPGAINKIKAARALQDEAIRTAGCQQWTKDHPEEAVARLTHGIHVLGGKAGTKENKRKAGLLGAANGGAKAHHIRWHVNRGKKNPECLLCRTVTALSTTGNERDYQRDNGDYDNGDNGSHQYAHC